MMPRLLSTFKAWLLSTHLFCFNGEGISTLSRFEVIVLKNQIKREFKLKGVVNSNEKEGTTNEISLSLESLFVQTGRTTTYLLRTSKFSVQLVPGQAI